MPPTYYNPNANYNYGADSSIAVDTLQKQEGPLAVAKPDTPAVYPANSIGVEELSQPEQSADTLVTQIFGLTDAAAGEDAFRTGLENKEGLVVKKDEQGNRIGTTQVYSDLSSQLKAYQREALAIPLQVQNEFTGRASVAGMQGISEQRLRVNAIKALETATLLEAERGRISFALDLIDRAVEQKYGPIRAQIDAKTKNLQLIKDSPSFTAAQKRRADKALLDMEVAKKTLELRVAEQNEIYNIAVLAQQRGADGATVRKIQQAKTRNDAVVLAGDFLKDPKAQLELDKLRLDAAEKRAQIGKLAAETARINKETEEGTAEERKAAKAEKDASKDAARKAVQAQTIISELRTHGGFTEAVGFGPILDRYIRGTEAASFGAKFDQLKALLTLDNIKAFKGLGPMSEREFMTAQAAATALSLSQTETEFLQELAKLEEALASTFRQSSSDFLAEDEKAALDDFFLSSDGTALAPNAYFR